LLDVERGRFSDEALVEHAPSDPRDRAMTWYLTLGVLQRQGQIDAALRPRLSRPLDGIDSEVRTGLRLGTFEILFSRAARHAVVHEAVEVTRVLGASRATGFVNAILRRIEAAENLAPHDAMDHPAWLWRRWCERYGEEAATHWCRSNGEPAPLAIVARQGVEGLEAAWEARGLKVEPIELQGAPIERAFWLLGHHGSITQIPGFAEGSVWVQDPAAVAVADLVQATPGLRVLDACAAPGGKSARLLDTGAVVTSVDRKDRMQILQASLSRLDLPATFVTHDWSQGRCPSLSVDFDAVLVDAPCTGLGTVRRHPEIRWRRQPIDLLQAAERQRAILDAASEHLAPGGRLVYAVCSPEPEEGREIVASFLADHPGYVLEAELDTAPPRTAEDAHYAARLRAPRAD
jgi:16S rRNA (cytosine967-C5)-methyltransferase